jgi:SAM-dependent methyltransferase
MAAGTSIHTTIEVALDPAAAFAAFAEELAAGLGRLGIRFDPGPQGRVIERGAEVGRVVAWEHGQRMALEWHPADWQPDETTGVEVRFEAAGAGTRVTLEHQSWGGLIDGPGELVDWFAGQVVAPLLRATAPSALGDWLTDRGARRPTGAQARATYADPIYHYPNFRVILAELALTPADHLLEVGCGGGALLKEALRSGCRAAAVDHSPDMVRVASEANREAIAEGRLEIREASAQQLPFPDEQFTCAAMHAVLGFLPDPVAALAEIRRVLRDGGRVVVIGSDPEVKGTMAAPEPMASRLRFYDSEELEGLGRAAGFETVRVVRRSLEAFAREVGIPEAHLSLFAGPGPRFLLARKS